MVMCWSFGCTHNDLLETCTFFPFPQEPTLRKTWLTALRRIEEPGLESFLCSCHFKDGDNKHVPDIFPFNYETKFSERDISRETEKTSKVLATESKSVSKDPFVQCTKQVQPIASTSSENILKKEINECTQTEAENLFLKIELDKERRLITHSGDKMSYQKICNDDKLIVLYTGLPQKKIFDALFELMENIELNYIHGSDVENIDKVDQLLMTLMKLRQNFPFLDLAVRFRVSENTVSNVVITWVHALYEVLYKQLMSTIPSQTKCKSILPNCFSTFTDCRMILDCTEICIMLPKKSSPTQKDTESLGKRRATAKALVCAAPNGVVTYLSKLYTGSPSEKHIVQECGILNCMEPGDLVLADEDFLIKDILPPGVSLNIPQYLTTGKWQEAHVQQRIKTITKTRIHVKRAIFRMKCYKILNCIPFSLAPYSDVIFKAVGALTNFQYPLLRDIEGFFEGD